MAEVKPFSREELDSFQAEPAAPNNTVSQGIGVFQDQLFKRNPALGVLSAIPLTAAKQVAGLTEAGIGGGLSGIAMHKASNEAWEAAKLAQGGRDPAQAYNEWAVAQGLADQVPSYPGTEQVMAPIGESTPLDRMANLPAWAVQELVRSFTAHPRQQVGTIFGAAGGAVAGGAAGGIGAIPGAILGGGALGMEFGGPEYAGDITSEAFKGGAYPGAEKIGGRGINVGAIEGAGLFSAGLDSMGEVAAFAAPELAPVKSFLARMAMKMGEGAAIEGATEAAQQVAQNAAIGDPLEKDVAQSAAAGAILGGLIGTTGSFVGGEKEAKLEEGDDHPPVTPTVDPSSPPPAKGPIDVDFNESVVNPDQLAGPRPNLPGAKPEEAAPENAPEDTLSDPIEDIAKAGRYAEAELHKEDVFDMADLPQAEEGATRTYEPYEAYETQRLSEEEGIEAARTDIQNIMQEQGVDFGEAMEIFKAEGRHEKLGRLIAPSVHSTPFSDNDQPVPALKVTDRDSEGNVIRESVHKLPDGKTIKDYTDANFNPSPVEQIAKDVKDIKQAVTKEPEKNKSDLKVVPFEQDPDQESPEEEAARKERFKEYTQNVGKTNVPDGAWESNNDKAKREQDAGEVIAYDPEDFNSFQDIEAAEENKPVSNDGDHPAIKAGDTEARPDVRDPLSVAERQWLTQLARKQLDNMGATDINVKMADGLAWGADANYTPDGPNKRTIMISASRLRKVEGPLDDEVRNIINHEIVHAIMDIASIADPQRWARLREEIETGKPSQKQLDKLGWDKAEVGQTWLEALLEQFPDYAGENYEEMAYERSQTIPGLSIEEALRDLQVEEAIAEFTSLYGMRNDAIPAFMRPIVSKIFDYMRKVVRIVRQLFKKVGPERMDEVRQFAHEVVTGQHPIDENTELENDKGIRYKTGDPDWVGRDAEMDARIKMPVFTKSSYEPRDLVEMFNERDDEYKMAAELEIAAESSGDTREIKPKVIVAQGSWVRSAIKRAMQIDGGIDYLANKMDLTTDQLIDYVNNAGRRKEVGLREKGLELFDSGITDFAELKKALRSWATSEGRAIKESSIQATASKVRKIRGVSTNNKDTLTTPELREEIVQLRMAGAGPAAIAKKLNISGPAAISAIKNARDKGVKFPPIGSGAMMKAGSGPEIEPSDGDFTPVPAGFFSAVERAWQSVGTSKHLPTEAPLYKWFQRMSSVHKEFRPKRSELEYIFKGVPLDAVLAKETVDEIIRQNKLILKRNYSTDANGPDAIRDVTVRLPGNVSEKYESVLSLPEGVPGSEFATGHTFRAPIWVKGGYVSVLGERREVETSNGEKLDADFVGQIQSDMIQGMQDPQLGEMFVEKDLSGQTPPMADTEKFVRAGLGDAFTRAAANGREAIAIPIGDTADIVQRRGNPAIFERLENGLKIAEKNGDPKSVQAIQSEIRKYRNRAEFYSKTVRNIAEKMARRIGATVEEGSVPYQRRDPEGPVRVTPDGLARIEGLGFAESPRLQAIAKNIASLVNAGNLKRADLNIPLMMYQQVADQVGDPESSALVEEFFQNIGRHVEPIGGVDQKAPVLIIRLGPQARTKVISDGFPMFAAGGRGPRKSKAPRWNPPGMRFGAAVNPDPGTNQVLEHIGGFVEDVINVRQQQAAAIKGPKMLNKPIAGGIIDYASQVGTQAIKNVYTKLGLDGLFKWYSPFGRMNDAGTWELLRMIDQGRIAKVEGKISKLASVLSSREDLYDQIIDYITTAPGGEITVENIDTGETFVHSEALALERITDPKIQAAAVQAKKALNELGQMLVEHHMIDKGQYEKFKGSYLPGMYAKYIDSYKTPTGIRMSGVPYRYSKKGPKTSRGGTGYSNPDSTDLTLPGTDPDIPGVDYTVEGLGATDKALLGEIRDPGLLVSHAVIRGMRDMATANLLNAAVHHSATSPTNPKWVLEKTLVQYGGKPISLWQFAQEKERIDQQLNDEKDRLFRLRQNTSFQYQVLRRESQWMDSVLRASQFNDLYNKKQIPKDYKLVPTDPTKYGDLAGAIVRKEIYNDLMSSFAVFNPEEGTAGQLAQATMRKATNAFKMSKTVLSLGGQARQAYSNIMMVGLAGANPAVRVPQAIEQVLNHYLLGRPAPAFEAALAGGQTSATLTKAELRMLDELQRKLRDSGKQGRFWKSNEAMGGPLKIAKLLRDVAAKTGNTAAAAYQLTDTIAKIAIIIDEMERGQPPLIAAHKARQWLGDYSAVPPLIRSLRESAVAPFITYFYITLPNMVEVAATRPWTFWPYYCTSILLAGMTGAVFNGDDDDETNLFGIPLDVQSMEHAAMPWKKKHNTKDDQTLMSMVDQAKQTAPQYLKEDTFAQVLPWRDSYDRPQVYSAKPLFAFAPVPEAANAAMRGDVWKAMQSVGLNMGPAFAVGSVWATGIDPGLDRKIWDEHDPQAVRNARSLAYTLFQFTPPEVQSFAPPGNKIPLFSMFSGAHGVEAGRGYNAVTGRNVTKKGEPTWDQNQLWLREAGITLTPLDISKARHDRLEYDFNQPISRLKNDIKKMADRPDVAPDVREENVKDMQKELDRLIEERDQFKFDTARIATVELKAQRKLKKERGE